MEYERFVRRALLLPIAVPVLVSPLLLLDGVEATNTFGDIVAFLLWSLLFGGIPYLVFLIAFLAWMRDKPAGRVRRAVLLAPITYGAVLGVAILLMTLVSGRENDAVKLLASSGIFAGMGVALGYVYVVVTEGAWWLLGRRGGSASAPPAPLPAE